MDIQFRMGVKNFSPEELQADDLAPGLRTLAYLNPGGFLPAPRLALEPRRAGIAVRDAYASYGARDVHIGPKHLLGRT